MISNSRSCVMVTSSHNHNIGSSFIGVCPLTVNIFRARHSFERAVSFVTTTPTLTREATQRRNGRHASLARSRRERSKPSSLSSSSSSQSASSSSSVVAAAAAVTALRWLFQADFPTSPHRPRSPKAAKILEFGSPGCGTVVTCCSVW